jgi:putative long chain acyl-CoA synthase
MSEQRPLIVRVVDRIPVTTWYRPLTGPLREEGIPDPGERVRAWYLDASGERYRPLTGTARKRLVSPAYAGSASPE